MEADAKLAYLNTGAAARIAAVEAKAAAGGDCEVTILTGP
jgi:hypothetical protein